MGNLSAWFTVAVSLVLPIVASAYLCNREKSRWKPILLGIVTFVVFQICTRLPLLHLLQRQAWFVMLPANAPLLYTLFLGITAALFEEGGRYLVMRLLMKGHRTFGDGIAFGVGHGGIEAILLVGINTLVALVGGTLGASGLVFAAGMERLFTMAIHIAFSVMVLRAVRECSLGWAVLAFAVHAAVDTLAAYASLSGVPVWAIESALGILAAAAVLWLVLEGRRERKAKCEN